MSQRLIVLRHAEAVGHYSAASDYERGLTDRGREEARDVGKWLASRHYPVPYVLSSPALRAKQTAEAVSGLLAAELEIHWDERIYEAAVRQLLELLASLAASSSTVLLVGHNPGIQDLTNYLAGGDLRLGTACAAVLSLESDWHHLARGIGTIEAVHCPEH